VQQAPQLHSPANVSSAQAPRRVLAGFSLLGILLSFLGAILPAWGYHIETSFITVGNYFLSLNLGLILGGLFSFPLIRRKGIGFTLSLGCGLAAGGLFFLALVGPPFPAWWRVLGLLLVGGGGGFTNAGIFQTLAPIYERDRAATLNLAGALLGLGCLLASVLVAGAFYVYTVPSILFFLGLVPAFFLASYSRTKFPAAPAGHEPSFRKAAAEFRHPGAVLFALVLFFQFGNEWAVAGWLPLFLIQRLGVSPEAALHMLSFYWVCLLVGRLAAQALLPRVRHGRMLMASVLSAMFGCFILSFTDNRFGAWSGLVFVGAGFASIYPLLLEKIGFRFPTYHPGLFNGIVSLALTGGLLASSSLGYWADLFGIGIVMWLPFAGSVMVFLLLLLIWLEGKLSGGPV
jgi:MFS transporter, FHS family, glucose/mannose:H+ symporter